MIRETQRARRRNNYAKVWKRDKGICQYCGDPGESIDHVMPNSYVSRNNLTNMVVACTLCNSIAHNMIFRSFDAKREYIFDEREKRRRKTDKRLAQKPYGLNCEENMCEAPKWCPLHGLCWAAQGSVDPQEPPDAATIVEWVVGARERDTTLRITVRDENSLSVVYLRTRIKGKDS